jgi:hypothetical protein
MGTAWKMPIAVIGKPTGDGRQFDAGALSHRDLPLPFRYVAEDSGGHQNAVIVGHISKVGQEKDGLLPAQGEFYDGEEWPEDVRNAATAARMFVGKKVIGPSVDLDQAEIEHVPEPKAYAAWKKEQAGKLKAAKLAHAAASGGDCGCGGPVMAEEAYPGPKLRMVRKGRFASATLVHIPAFAELAGHAKLTPIDSHDPNVDGTTAALRMAIDGEAFIDADTGELIENDMEFGAAQDECDAEALAVANRKKRNPKAAQVNQDDEEFGSGIWLSDADFEEFARKKLPRPNRADEPEMQGTDGEQAQGGSGLGGGTYAAPDVTKAGVRNKLDDADFVDPEGRRFPIASCADIADAVSSYGRANPKIPYAKFKTRLTAIAKRKGCADSLPENWKAGEKMAALMASAAPTAPPKEWFDNPKLTGPTPLHIGDDGRVYGHVAVWDTCHVGIGDSCVKPPKSLTSYAYFHTGEVKTADGSRVAVGRLTYGGGHAAPNLGYRAAAEHYDRTSNTGAYVRAGEDDHGIWVAGMLAPDADEAAVFKMRAAPLSGDWRRVGTNLEMVAALHVNTAGFPIPRVGLAASAAPGALDEDGDVFSLVAAGSLVNVADEADTAAALTLSAALQDTEALGRAIARAMAEENAKISEAAFRAEREGEWRELVASATADDIRPAYDDALGDLVFALAEE